ncbi:MAG: FliI/YscN family ATPase [Proteobacteria bacterium]|nr:FliI/YscN family ATPase [Pseudomonadota bacterium]
MDFKALEKSVDSCTLPVCRGKVVAAKGLTVEAELPGARVGMRVVVERSHASAARLPAEVALCDGTRVTLLPLAETTGIGPGDAVTSVAEDGNIPCGTALLGRIIDPLGAPVDGGVAPDDWQPWPIERPAPDPLSRKPIDRQLATGVRAIDGCIGLGFGQRIGLFAGPGLGKSMLVGMLARRARCDVSVVCLVGERGREVREFTENVLGTDGLSRSVVVLAKADDPPIVRARALHTATAVAEWFRADGQNVLLLVDSLTRVVRARRDMALALGERPARRGFPASSFSVLPALIERTGCDERGSITAIYTVLTENDNDDPVAEEARSLLDGHIVLSSKLAKIGHWPAIDVNRSISRVMGSVVSKEQARAGQLLRRLLGAYEEQEDLILMGAYRKGTSSDTDLAIARKTEIETFLRQEDNLPETMETTQKNLRHITRGMDKDR